MIRIKIKRQGDGRVLGFRVSGHAEYTDGPDIVCAAVSALVNSVNIALTKYLEKSQKPSLVEEEADGLGSMFLQCEADDLTEAIFSVATLGFEEVQKRYPKCVKIC